MLDVKLLRANFEEIKQKLAHREKIYQILINLRNWIQREEN